ncbi:MAG TPA: hypothetical protein ENI64_10605 [Gammaproteobacteria bacterium]|nr:hypothetical protein [Gammaproteobacteria bacterium]
MCFSFVLAVPASSAPGPDQFRQLLQESSLRFEAPPGYTDIKPVANPVLHYERALQHQSGQLEIRIVIRPLGRIVIDYSNPHNAKPEPNHLFPLLFESMTAALSRGGRTPSSAYPYDQAHSLFNADWAAATVLDVSPDFSSTYDQALLIAIHKDGLADAYTIFLFNEYEHAKEFITPALAALSFTPQEAVGLSR